LSALKYWIWLSSLSGIGPVTAARLLERFGSPENVFKADAREYRDIEGVGYADIKKLAEKDVGAANRILASCAEQGCRILTFQDAEYPERLKNIYDPPLVLYVRGSLPVIDEEAVVAIVGTRDCTPYGVSAAESIARGLSLSGLVIATGLARGIDSAAARGALRGGGRVIGVIGSGPDIVYPGENRQLFGDVISSGAIVSEYPPGTPATRAHFPARNRLISGISLGVAVIEAPSRSGALITASRALEQGRDVFTLPGNVDARSCEGSNALLKEGAIPVLSGDDIIAEYAELFPGKIKPGGHKEAESKGAAPKKGIDNIPPVDYIDLDKITGGLSGDEKTVAGAIGTEAPHVDDVIVSTGLPAQQVLTALTMLEIKGLVTRTAYGTWKIKTGN